MLRLLDEKSPGQACASNTRTSEVKHSEKTKTNQINTNNKLGENKGTKHNVATIGEHDRSKQENQHKTSNIPSTSTENLTVPQHKNENIIRNKQTRLVGEGASVNNVTAVEFTAKSWVHVSRLNPNLEVEEFLNFLKKKHNTEDIMCTKIMPKNVTNPYFSSFKVGIHPSLEETLLTNPKVWPKGAFVNKYLFRKPFQSRYHRK